MRSLSERANQNISSSMSGLTDDLAMSSGVGIPVTISKIYIELLEISQALKAAKEGAGGVENLTVVSNDSAGDVARIYEDLASAGLMKN